MRGKGTICIKGVIILLTVLVLQGTNWAAAEELTVMTRNLYLGADLTPMIAAENKEQFLSAVFDIMGTIVDNSFPERAAAMAGEIVEKKPHLVGLQEVLNFTIDRATPGPPFNDYLEELLKALKARGADYRVAAVVKNLDLEFPFGTNLIGVLDRDVILARGDVRTDVVDLTGLCQVSQVSEDGCNFITAANLPNPLATQDDPLPPVVIKRSYVAIDAWIGTRSFPVRFVNTHLEVRDLGQFGFLQAAQASELTQILRAFNSLRAQVIVVGDFDSDPRDPVLDDPVLDGPIVPPYMQLTRAGFVDAWTLRPGNPDGYTCCQEEDLVNRKSVLFERVDLIFSSMEPERVKVNLVGDEIPDKQPSGLWPSDHAGVVGRIEFAQ